MYSHAVHAIYDNRNNWSCLSEVTLRWFAMQWVKPCKTECCLFSECNYFIDIKLFFLGACITWVVLTSKTVTLRPFLL